MATFATLAGISLLIALHELGHLGAAVALGMQVLRYSLGFGPSLIARRAGGIIWQVAAIPMGGFVQVAGMGPEMDEASDAAQNDVVPPVDPARSYRHRPRWQRALVVAAGPATNWLLALAGSICIAGVWGLPTPQMAQARVGQIAAGSAAEQAGLQVGDRIVAVADAPVASWAQMAAAIRQRPKQQTQLVIERLNAAAAGGAQTAQNTASSHLAEGPAAERRRLLVVPQARSDGAGSLGISPPTLQLPLGWWAACRAGTAATVQATADHVRLLVGLVRGGEGRLSGLPGIVRQVSQTTRQQGMAGLMPALVALSLSLCLLNLLPIPGLDGAHLVLLALETLRRRPLSARVEVAVQTGGMVFLLGLMLVVSVRDFL